MSLQLFNQRADDLGDVQVYAYRQFANRLWKEYSPIELQNKLQDSWDNSGYKIKPLVPVPEDRPVTNLIFGSGSFSTGNYQAEKYNLFYQLDNPPVKLQGIVANKSLTHGCKGSLVAKETGFSYIELDFADWYHNNIDNNEKTLLVLLVSGTSLVQ